LIPEAATTRSRIDCVPEIVFSSSSVKAHPFLGREIEVHSLSDSSDSASMSGVSFSVRPFILRFHLRLATDDVSGWRDDDMVGIAPIGGDGFLDCL